MRSNGARGGPGVRRKAGVEGVQGAGEGLKAGRGSDRF